MRVVLISTEYKGKANIMAAAWCFPLSADPPLFGVAISKKRHTYEMIKKAGSFSINTVAEDMKQGMFICGTKSGKDIDKFKETGWTKENGKTALSIKEAPLSIECKLENEFETGDHIVFVGKVMNVIKRRQVKTIYHRGGDQFELM
jgi:flavin reductase (DIM6/NTAB) family NADH-FMN oxidoreductase RutF